MSKAKDFITKIDPTWCPGCGNFGIWLGVRQAAAELGFQPHQLALFFDIGCNGNGANYFNAYNFHGLHGRAVPAAIGAKLANHKLTVLVFAGDGGAYGEGGNHFIAACRSNIDITLIVHDNKRYSLTTGQASPTSSVGTKSKATPDGSFEVDFQPLQTAIANGATFVARAYADDTVNLTKIIKTAINHRGFSLVDVLQPCPTFNRDNTRDWYKSRLYNLQDQKWDATNKNQALVKAGEWGEKIPVGILYQVTKSTYKSHLPQLKNQSLVEQELKISPVIFEKLLAELK